MDLFMQNPDNNIMKLPYSKSVLLFFPVFFYFIILLTAVYPVHPRIFQKTCTDGSIELYNMPASKKTYKFKNKYNSLIEKISKNESVDPYLVKCLIKIESNFKPDAVSKAGAMGLMQLMQSTASHYRVKDPLDPGENLKAGIRHLKFLLRYFKNDIPLALAAYHAGLGRVKRKMAVPPIKSTVMYVKKIMILYNGTGNHTKKINRLYKKINKDGTIIIYSK